MIPLRSDKNVGYRRIFHEIRLEHWGVWRNYFRRISGFLAFVILSERSRDVSDSSCLSSGLQRGKPAPGAWSGAVLAVLGVVCISVT